MSKRDIEERVRELYEVNGLTVGQIHHNLKITREHVATIVIKYRMKAAPSRGWWSGRKVKLFALREDPNVPRRAASSVEEFISKYGVTVCPPRFAAPSPQGAR